MDSENLSEATVLSDSDHVSSEDEAGKFVKIQKDSITDSHSSEDCELSSEDDVDSLNMQALRKRYKQLLRKFKMERQRNEKRKQMKQKTANKRERTNASKSLAERIRGWQNMELEKFEDHKQQFHAWLAFKSIVEANWTMYGIVEEDEKLVCLQTKCKGFVVELINSIQRGKPNFEDIWNGLETRFYAPINIGEETSTFYQMKQDQNENIFNFFERVAKQAYLCNFSVNDSAKNIGETFARNCLNPAYFLGVLDKFDDLDKLKQHAKNFHAALPIMKHQPVLAINQQRYSRDFHTYGSNKRTFESKYNSQKRRRMDSNFSSNSQRLSNCKYCGGSKCNGRNCPARGQKCNYCSRFDHFEKVCLRKQSDAINKMNSVNAVTQEEHDEKVILPEN